MEKFDPQLENSSSSTETTIHQIHGARVVAPLIEKSQVKFVKMMVVVMVRGRMVMRKGEKKGGERVIVKVENIPDLIHAHALPLGLYLVSLLLVAVVVVVVVAEETDRDRGRMMAITVIKIEEIENGEERKKVEVDAIGGIQMMMKMAVVVVVEIGRDSIEIETLVETEIEVATRGRGRENEVDIVVLAESEEIAKESETDPVNAKESLHTLLLLSILIFITSVSHLLRVPPLALRRIQCIMLLLLNTCHLLFCLAEQEHLTPSYRLLSLTPLINLTLQSLFQWITMYATTTIHLITIQIHTLHRCLHCTGPKTKHPLPPPHPHHLPLTSPRM